jgi:2-ketocyclohexanecarboxyl-CoA hydrolase
VSRYKTLDYAESDGVAWVTLNRPEVHNAFDRQMMHEVHECWRELRENDDVRVVVLTGAGDKAFCTGGDVKQRALTGDYGPTGNGLFEIDYLQRLMREIPKPVIAAVNGLAVGGGHVLQVLCDLSIAASTARFGQAGPKVGSFDAGFGTAYLARVVGEKRARELWYLCRLYSADEVASWGLVNKVVAPGQVLAEARAWADEIALKAPTAIKFLKASFNADTEHQAGLSMMAAAGLKVYVDSEEAREGAAAFADKRIPDFANFAV